VELPLVPSDPLPDAPELLLGDPRLLLELDPEPEPLLVVPEDPWLPNLLEDESEEEGEGWLWLDPSRPLDCRFNDPELEVPVLPLPETELFGL